MDIRTISGSWEAASAITIQSGSGSWKTSGHIAVNGGSGSWETSGETSIYSSTGGWKTSGELKMVGSQVHLNSPGKTPSAPSSPPSPIEPEINPKMQFYNQNNSRYNAELGKWYVVQKDFESLAVFTPTHEPWARASGKLKLNNGEVYPPERQYIKK